MDNIFRALANPARRKIMDIVRAHPASTVSDLCEHFEMSRIGVMKHLRILETAGLILSRVEGRRRLLYVNAIPIQKIYDRWTTDWGAIWAQEITDIKNSVESTTGKKSKREKNYG